VPAIAETEIETAKATHDGALPGLDPARPERYRLEAGGVAQLQGAGYG
jgi:hypothetical protein